MKYTSTRGGVTPVGFAEAVMMGLGTDGGLLVPESLPHFDESRLRTMAGLDFQGLAFAVMQPFVDGEIPDADLKALIARSYAGFSDPRVTPVHQAGDRRYLELFHGPTAAFKDVALQFLGNCFEYLLERDGGTLNILGATSGDTGSAAIYGVRGKARIQIFMLHPKGRVSPIQERQMITVLDDNVHNIAIRGTFDDAQRIVKTLFNELDFKQRFHLGAVNSINWVRILAQTVYYFHAWSQVTGGDPDRHVDFAVPSGNFGDVFAGFLARRMGLPVGRLIIATNRNDILTRFVETGVYAKGEVHHTLSPAMDIQVASNFERYLFYLLDEDAEAVRGLFADLDAKGRFAVDAAHLMRVQQDFSARAVTDEQTLAQIQETFETSGYILCPHTAVGAVAAGDDPEAVVLATAHPAKFNEAVEAAIGQPAPAPPSLQGLDDLPSRCLELDGEAQAIRECIRETLEAAKG